MLFKVMYKKKVYPVYAVMPTGAVMFLLWDKDKKKWIKALSNDCEPVT